MVVLLWWKILFEIKVSLNGEFGFDFCFLWSIFKYGRWMDDFVVLKSFLLYIFMFEILFYRWMVL